MKITLLNRLVMWTVVMMTVLSCGGGDPEPAPKIPPIKPQQQPIQQQPVQQQPVQQQPIQQQPTQQQINQEKQKLNKNKDGLTAMAKEMTAVGDKIGGYTIPPRGQDYYTRQTKNLMEDILFPRFKDLKKHNMRPKFEKDINKVVERYIQVLNTGKDDLGFSAQPEPFLKLQVSRLIGKGIDFIAKRDSENNRVQADFNVHDPDSLEKQIKIDMRVSLCGKRVTYDNSNPNFKTIYRNFKSFVDQSIKLGKSIGKPYVEWSEME